MTKHYNTSDSLKHCVISNKRKDDSSLICKEVVQESLKLT